MAPTKKPQKAAKKEYVYHPGSRKVEWLARKQLRKSKLARQASNHAKLHIANGKLSENLPTFTGFFFHAIPEERGIVLTLPELLELVSDVWLTQHDAELEEERAARRKGRPKSAKEEELEQVKLLEAQEYRTGMGVPDLRHPENVPLCRTRDQREVAFTAGADMATGCK